MLSKEEIENIEEIKKMLNFTTNETSLRINNKVSKLLLKYMKDLEQTNEILDKECSRLEEKEIILHKTTDKLKEIDFRLYLQKEEDRANGLNIEILTNMRKDITEILEIGEGEKK